MSQYGKWVIEKFVPELVANKFAIISGFMYGVDTTAHRETLECGGVTIAVLGGGLNIFTPPENEKMYWEILEKGGLIISEYDNDFQPTLWSFPQRNRIVSGLAKNGVLVIEAGMKSGSLITARLATEQGKKLFAVPGPINSSVSAGVNYLIKEKGGIMVTSPEDITSQKIKMTQLAMDITDPFEKEIIKYLTTQLTMDIIDPFEKQIIKYLKIESLSTDELAKKLNKKIMLMSSKLMIMNMENKITENLGKWIFYK